MSRPYKYATADDFKQAATNYFLWCDQNPIRGQRTVTKEDGEVETRDTQYPRPYTIEGLCDELGITNWTKFVADNRDRDGFADAIGWAKNKIRRHQVEGSLAGLYREGLTARLNGIADNMNINDKPAINILPDAVE